MSYHHLADQFVYFFLNRVTNVIKIGITQDLDKRQIALEREQATTLYLLASIRGHITDERIAHHVCRAHRVHGEWFKNCVEVRAYIRSILGYRLDSALREITSLVLTYDKHKDDENGEWREDMLSAIHETTNEYERLSQFSLFDS